MAAILVEHLVKRYGELIAVNDISFEVRPGEVFGMLGPNGAGKTTTLEIIEGLQPPTSGRTVVLGHDSQKESRRVKMRIGVQLQASAYFDYLTLGEILELFASFYGRRVDISALLETVGLADKRHALVKHLSGGQKQRFSIVASLVNDPEIVFLDEPTTGLDPQARRHLWEYIRRINDEGKTVVLTTHYMEEAQTLCDRIAIVDLGSIVALDSPSQLIHALGASYRVNVRLARRIDPALWQNVPGIHDAHEIDGTGLQYQLQMERPAEGLPALIGTVEQAGIGLEGIEVLTATLEDVFLHLTGKALRD